MPTPISGTRVARSIVTPAGIEVVTREINFQLGPRMGIEIFSVLPSVALFDVSETTNTVHISSTQTLHLETGSLETVGRVAAEDEDTIDSEIIFRQDVICLVAEEAATRGGSLVSVVVTPNGLISLNPSMFAARNLTHRGENHQAAAVSVVFVLTLYYRYVIFSLSELGLILARRT